MGLTFSNAPRSWWDDYSSRLCSWRSSTDFNCRFIPRGGQFHNILCQWYQGSFLRWVVSGSENGQAPYSFQRCFPRESRIYSSSIFTFPGVSSRSSERVCSLSLTAERPTRFHSSRALFAAAVTIDMQSSGSAAGDVHSGFPSTLRLGNSIIAAPGREYGFLVLGGDVYSVVR